MLLKNITSKCNKSLMNKHKILTKANYANIFIGSFKLASLLKFINEADLNLLTKKTQESTGMDFAIMLFCRLPQLLIKKN